MRSRFTRAFVCLCLCLGLAACAPVERYSYEAVKQEFAAPAPSPAPAPAPPSAGQAPAPAPAPAGPDWSRPLGLNQAVQVALAHNPEQEMALMRVRQAEALFDQSLAAFLPMLTLYTEYTRGDAPSAYLFKIIDQRRLAPDTNFNAPGTFQNWESGARLRWNLFRGGQDYLRRRMAAEGVAISQLDRATVQNTLTASVIKGYYNCLAAADMTAVAGQAVESVAAQLKQTEVRFSGGGALKSDVLSLRVRLAQAREDEVRAANNQRLALAALATLLGADPDTELRLSGQEADEPRVPPTYAQAVVEAMGRRPELAKVRHQVVAARMALDAARAEHLPRVDAQGAVFWDDPLAQYEGERGNYSVGAALSWDAFTGFSTVHGTAKARAALREVLAADRLAGMQVQMDVKSAYLGLAEAIARLQVSRAAVEQAQEALGLTKTQYNGGAADITRYLDAELNLNAARARRIAAGHDARKARADIARALGLFGDAAIQEVKGHE
ncbi:MAG: TolC family protein [Pseudomonadota bacterium]